jgi:hypothetical protein
MVAWAHGRHSSLLLQGLRQVCSCGLVAEWGATKRSPLAAADCLPRARAARGGGPHEPHPAPGIRRRHLPPGCPRANHAGPPSPHSPCCLPWTPHTAEKVYSADDTAAANIARHLGVRQAHDGLLAADIPVVPRAFQAGRADTCADDASGRPGQLAPSPRQPSMACSTPASTPRRYSTKWQRLGQALQGVESIVSVCSTFENLMRQNARIFSSEIMRLE